MDDARHSYRPLPGTAVVSISIKYLHIYSFELSLRLLQVSFFAVCG